MKKFVKDAKEMRKIMFENKDKFIGTAITLEGGFKLLVIDVEKSGIRSMPFNGLVTMKKNELEKCLSDIFSPDKVPVAMLEVEKRKKEIDEIYS